MQQPIRKSVGRPPSPRKVLWQLEQIREFTRKHTHGKPALAEGDALPVRKTVGRPRPTNTNDILTNSETAEASTQMN